MSSTHAPVGHAPQRTPDAEVAALLRLARPGARRMLPGILFGILSGLSAVLLLGVSAYLITRAAEQPPILYLGLLVVGVRAFALARAFFRYMERLSSHDAAFRTLATLRVGLIERLMPVAPVGLAEVRRGDLLARLVRDVDELLDLPTRVIQPLVSSGVVVMVTLGALAWFSPMAAVVLAVVLAGALVVGTAVNTAISGRAERRTAALRGELADEVADLVTDLDVLIAYSAVEPQLRRVEQADARLRAAALRTVSGAGVVAGLLTSAAGAATVLMLTVGIPQVSPSVPLGPEFVLTPGAVDGPVLAVLALVPLAVFEVFAAAPAAWSVRRRVLASARRIADLAPQSVPPEIPVDDGDDEIPDPDGPRDAALRRHPAAPAVLQLEAMTVRRPGASAPVCAPVNLTLHLGQVVLVSGASGSGKTSLAEGLVRFLEYAGSYRIDGVEARELSIAALRRRVCLIEQRAHLFDATLRANLSFAHPEGPEAATDGQLMAVLEAVGLGEWARSRDGLETRVGLGGALVSGGQAQRIAVARGLLSGADVLVLDEPTAHVEPELAARLMRELLGATAGEGRSVVVMSHLPVPEHLVDAHVDLDVLSGDDGDVLSTAADPGGIPEQRPGA
ncbi:thiol reductant ABC exporter subunit CydC [Nesterenkonia aerolata]|uniref:Thiol reductant ABC exporter subunit CydC n=1 Tax=Nesterenkonia aerolata TaxID=3074079 RepID=A0ABU2DUG0_9MICC|nr:thiol reductant ABC exporter subunit CydC [Nesterenkonia sp. LY-0111]MDR8020031.1 thiol reductant ABC exporter subunit CydC [Nesterenkonia sp. LY-0111]